MGVPPFLITATIEAILAQRLVRRICTQCREEVHPSSEILADLELSPSDIRGKKFYRGKGCDNCNRTGYKGRVGLFELMLLNDDIRDMIIRNASTDELREAWTRFTTVQRRPKRSSARRSSKPRQRQARWKKHDTAMTNSETRMTKQARMTNDERAHPVARFVRHSDFVIDSSFGFRRSSFTNDIDNK
jgi:type II secretory ATPase GspE/PulE/Tfp pilus assembly ATPase PilB-like protein